MVGGGGGGGWRTADVGMYVKKSTMKKMHSQDRSHESRAEETEKKKGVLYRTMIVMIYSTWRGI